MAAANTDKNRKGTNNFSTTLAGSIGASDTTISLTSTTNLPTDTAITLVIDRVNASGVVTPSTREYVLGVISGTNLINVLRGQGNSTGQSHATGAVIESVWTSQDWNDHLSAFLASHNQDGSLITSAVQTAIGTGNQSAGWTSVGFTPTYATNNGNKEFTCTVANDLRNTLSAGMKIQVTRGTTPPTQAMSFTAASSQYATKASPTGITFTSAFTCEAWVYLNSYQSSAQVIIGRRNNTSGAWFLRVDSTGTVSVGYGDGSGNFTLLSSYQSLPLKRWIHVAGVVTSVSSKTGAVYINGVSVPVNANQAFAATSLVQSGSLTIGSDLTSAQAEFFDGYISEARVWSVAQSQASIQANMGINCVGNETNLVALFQGNGAWTDGTSNANTLTATNGATFVTANPYHSVEYGVVTNISYSNPNTTLTIFTGTDYVVPNQTLSNFQYSTQRAPYGFPAGRDKWVSDAIFIAQANATGTVGAWQQIGAIQASIPVGEWVLVHKSPWLALFGANTSFQSFIALSTSTNSVSDSELEGLLAGATVVEGGTLTTNTKPINLASDTTYYQIIQCSQNTGAGSITHYVNFNNQPTVIRAECAYI